MDIKIPYDIYNHYDVEYYEACIKKIDALVSKRTPENHSVVMNEVQKVIYELCDEVYHIGYKDAY